MIDVEPKQKIYSISEINHRIRLLLDGAFASLWLEGEISNFKHHSSGHMYFTLKDEKSQISAVFFNGQNRTVKFQPKDGLKVLVSGRISSYEPRGQYQVYVEQMLPKGMGALQLAFLQLKEKLEKEGLFDPAHKKEIPKFPTVLGVITSPTGAAIRDILNVVSRRFHGTRVLIYPVQVQGAEAAPQIAQAIRDMNQMKEVDVMIVGRGGGSLEDLWAFNEEAVARAIYQSAIPIISAVGHEIDWTISDLAADLRAPTPSAAAELVVQNRTEIERQVADSARRMHQSLTGRIEQFRNQLESIGSSYAFKQPHVLIEQFAQKLDDHLRQLQNYLKSFVTSQKQAFGAVCGKLNALSPLGIMERGYSITLLADGKLLKQAEQIKIGDELTTRLKKSMVLSEIKQIKEVKYE